jgi:histidyl-tRNA synthetase
MEELNIFPKDAHISSQVLICHFDDASLKYGLNVLSKLRTAGIASEIYPEISKLKKQLDFANKKMIPYTLVIGSEEMNAGLLAFKNMANGEQQKLTVDQIVKSFSNLRISL